MLKKVLIIGASGFLGKEVCNVFQLDKNYETCGTYSKTKTDSFEYLDITELKSISRAFLKIRPDIVIVTAALTNVEYCETNREETYKINVLGIENLVKVSKQYKCRVIYISSEYVFDGVNGPYDEKDKVNPINYYGETKLQGEEIIQREVDDYLIVRTTVVYGWDLNSKNFIMQLIKNFGKNKDMRVPMDQISSPTYCPNLSQMIKECCDKNISGILNLVGSDIIDRYSFAVNAAEILNLDRKLLVPIQTKCLRQIAKRPLNAGLKVNKVSEILENKPMSIIEGLGEIRILYKKYSDKLNEEVAYE
ncbi:SDR family oxidoreductase [Clostridium estertheticum]|uniref:SDR family oxidoreductase n=1 Tax=Clostridium estertheticum TaxID=238834 RepID=UPI001C0C7942|nr:SDR family oxidoreductase [Clostridium estertheticum]MBU3176430.1 SDR family oxidoreductase [Clostridium estertheticum]